MIRQHGVDLRFERHRPPSSFRIPKLDAIVLDALPVQELDVCLYERRAAWLKDISRKALGDVLGSLVNGFLREVVSMSLSPRSLSITGRTSRSASARGAKVCLLSRARDNQHIFASQAVVNGGPLPVVARLLGHTETRMTIRYAPRRGS